MVGERAGTEVDIPKESFIPYNSAVVVNVNANVNLSPKIATAFDREIKAFRKVCYVGS